MSPAKNLGGTVREITVKDTFERLKPLLTEFGITRCRGHHGTERDWDSGSDGGSALGSLAFRFSGKRCHSRIGHRVGHHGEHRGIPCRTESQSATIHNLFECDRDPSFVSPLRLPIRADCSTDYSHRGTLGRR